MLLLAIFTVNLFANFILFEFSGLFVLDPERLNLWKQLFFLAEIYTENFYQIHLCASIVLFGLTVFQQIPWKSTRFKTGLFPKLNFGLSALATLIILVLIFDSLALVSGAFFYNWVLVVVKDAIYFAMLAMLICQLPEDDFSIAVGMKFLFIFALGFLVTVYISYDWTDNLINRGAVVKFTIASVYGFFLRITQTIKSLIFALLPLSLMISFAVGARLFDAQEFFSDNLHDAIFDILISFEHTIVRNVQLLNEIFVPPILIERGSFLESFKVLIPLNNQEKGLAYFVNDLYVAIGKGPGGFASGMLFQGALIYGTPVGIFVGICFSFIFVSSIVGVVNQIRMPMLKSLFGIYFATILYDFFRYDFGVILRKTQYSFFVCITAYVILLLFLMSRDTNKFTKFSTSVR